MDHLYLFIVREDRSVFPFAARYRLAEEATRHVPNVVLLDTSRYAVSAGTFPSYFLRRDDEKARLQMEVDVRLFGAHLAPAFGITRRFVGHEPYCETTAAYNRTMAEVLPRYGVALVEVRARRRGRPVHQRHRRARGAGGGRHGDGRASRAAVDAGVSAVGRAGREVAMALRPSPEP